MNEAETRLSIADIAAIELMRMDPEHARYCEGVDDRIEPAITSRFPTGQSEEDIAANPYTARLVAQRAKLYCQEVQGVNVDQHADEISDWLKDLFLVGAIVFVLGCFYIAFAGPAPFFGTNKTANISSFSNLVLVMFAISLVSMIGLILMLVQWFYGTVRGEHSEARKPTIVIRLGWRCLDLLQRLLSLIFRRPVGPGKKSLKLFKAAVNRQVYYASAVSLLSLNLCMLVATFAIWVALYFYADTHDVAFAFPNSTKTQQQRVQRIEFIGYPAAAIWSPCPSKDAVNWADGLYIFDESEFFRKDIDGTLVPLGEEAIKAIKQQRFDEFQHQWTHFFIGGVLAWLVLPRALVCLICGVSAWCFRHDLLPDPNDESVRRIVLQVIGSGEFAVISHVPPASSAFDPIADEQLNKVVPPDSGPDQPLADARSLGRNGGSEVPEHASRSPDQGIRPVVDASQRVSATSSILDVPHSPVRWESFRIVGYELDDASYGRLSALAQLLKTAKVDQNLNGAREQKSFVDELDSDDRVVVVASLLETADDSFREFVEDVGRITAVKVVLTDGAAAREEYKDQPSTYDMSLEEWKSVILQAGINDTDILAHDLSNDQGVSLAASALDARYLDSDESGIMIAGRYVAAVKIIDRHVNSLLSASPPSQAMALQNVDDELSQLYASEKRSFANRLKQLKPTQRIQDELSKVKLPSDISGQCVRAAGMVYGGLLNRLPTRWAMAGGLSGMAVGTVGGLAAVTSGGTAVLPMLLPIIVGHTVSGAGIVNGFKLWLDRKASKTGTSEPSHYEEASDVTLARCGVIQTLIYELQGNSESVISDEIGHITNRLDRIDPPTSEKLLTHFAGEMEEMEGQR
ncbi:hypothetical protein CKO51_27175 [Rhodopirellula sp. SM50]|nr:DUF2868 domain-containing protein [Rhodopirellula sp. SM50]PAY16338.1 hypothetical protein CKO51_27175 [Rhodopirellula sp. SM50]